MTSLTHRLVIAGLPELSTKAHRCDVVHHCGDPVALYTQRVSGEVRTSVPPPLRCVVARLLVPTLVHAFAWLGVGHTRHHSRPRTYNSMSTNRCQNKRSPVIGFGIVALCKGLIVVDAAQCQ